MSQERLISLTGKFALFGNVNAVGTIKGNTVNLTELNFTGFGLKATLDETVKN